MRRILARPAWRQKISFPTKPSVPNSAFVFFRALPDFFRGSCLGFGSDVFAKPQGVPRRSLLHNRFADERDVFGDEADVLAGIHLADGGAIAVAIAPVTAFAEVDVMLRTEPGVESLGRGEGREAVCRGCLERRDPGSGQPFLALTGIELDSPIGP